RTADGIPNVRYTETVEVSLYYDDEESLWKKFGIYKNAGAAKIAFWRIGQENPEIWQKISSEEK
ncbi:MAG TPA: glycoside hydrolase, partial [Spirochaetota bacterium]|nr:glycoside hydrolase [Spirochaetota bacterium]